MKNPQRSVNMTRNAEANREATISRFLSMGGGDIQQTRTVNHQDDSYLAEFTPLEVHVYGNFDRAFKTFRSMVQKDRILSQYKMCQSFEKPSAKRRRKRNEMKQKRMELEAKQQKILSGEFEKEMIKKQKVKDLKQQLRSERSKTNSSE